MGSDYQRAKLVFNELLASTSDEGLYDRACAVSGDVGSAWISADPARALLRRVPREHDALLGSVLAHAAERAPQERIGVADAFAELLRMPQRTMALAVLAVLEVTKEHTDG